MNINQSIVRELLHYDPLSGVLTWKLRDVKWFKNHKQCSCNSWNTRHAGSVAGSYITKKHSKKTYLQISLFDKWYFTHHIVWLYVHGYIPDCIDHINGNGCDNSIFNLRETTHAENAKNKRMNCRNKSGVTGVSWDKNRKCWQAGITCKGKAIGLGRFKDFFEAVCTRKSAELRLDFHSNHGMNRPL